ncbi:hypothetical protein ACFQYP_53555 [Nonomuraea antimicrobica]
MPAPPRGFSRIHCSARSEARWRYGCSPERSNSATRRPIQRSACRFRAQERLPCGFAVQSTSAPSSTGGIPANVTRLRITSSTLIAGNWSLRQMALPEVVRARQNTSWLLFSGRRNPAAAVVVAVVVSKGGC